MLFAYIQIKASFEYWFFGSGWDQGVTPSNDEKPQKSVVVRCDGPDGGYIATSGCVLSCAMTVLRDHANMPKQG